MSLLTQLNLATNRSRSKMTATMFAQFRAFIYDQTGIFFQDNKQYLLESRIARRVSVLGMPDYESYFRFLSTGGLQAERTALINAITINESRFFRHPAQFNMLEQHLLPEVIRANQQKGYQHVRLWSAACASGEEPYTLALIVKDKLMPRFPGVRFEIVGTDINTDVLAAAKVGTYGDRAVRGVPAPMLQHYFTSTHGRHTLCPDVRSLVRFQHLNLSDRKAMLRMRRFDVILCANVLIYFDAASKQHVMASLYNSLQTDGYLLVGFSETLYGITQAFQPVRFEKMIAYQKG